MTGLDIMHISRYCGPASGGTTSRWPQKKNKKGQKMAFKAVHFLADVFIFYI